MYYVYLLESLVDKSWYIGFTPDSPFNRLKKHNSGQVYYSKRKKPWRIVYFEAYLFESDATSREKFLKSGSGRRYIKKQLKNWLAACERSELYAAPSSNG